MCGLCGVLAPREHWTEAGQDGEGLQERRVAGTRRRERAHQVRVANRVLAHYGLTLADWQGSSYVLSNRTGASVVIGHFGALWPSAERMAKRPCDPLDAALIGALAAKGKPPSKSAHASRRRARGSSA